MNIDVNIKLDEESAMNPEKTEVASGWVEIEDCIKFPVRVRKYTDKEGKQKMFVTYPQRKKGEKYEGIVYPHDAEVRNEIEEKVLKEVGREAVKDIGLPTVESVRVSLVKQNREASVILRGFATIKIAGMTINGITIKEGQQGLFVQMPQYKSGGEYRDTVYGTNKGIHTLIKNKVLEAYDEVLKEEQKHQEERKEQEQQTEQEQTEQQEKQTEQEAQKMEQQTEKIEQEEQSEIKAVSGFTHLVSNSYIDRFIQNFQNHDKQGMLEIFTEAEKEIANAAFTENFNAVRLQGAVMADDNRVIDVSFHNSWDPRQQIPPNDYLTQKIEACIYEDGNIKGFITLVEKKSKSLKNAEKNYNEVLSLWKELTKQERIEIPQEQHKPETRQKAVPVPGFR